MSAQREPIFNAPWPALAIVAAIVGGYALQSLFPQDPIIARYGFSPAGFAAGERASVVTALFIHGGWAHALMNAAGALAFGAPVARLFGLRVAGVAAFFAFYLICGVISIWSYALIHPGAQIILVGASGAVSGLMGAVSRLLAGRGRLGPFLSAPVIGMAAAWVIINLLVAVLGLTPGMGQTPVAWEAHLTGYAAGLLLVGPFAWALRRS
ncbi:rhomboid family intramembrane serine protease [Phenylobacterium sp.]|uniref:rhomboid family intramembrane serine protease n=1 Tax=Phenylobacterium sp. TaxID=1871053 RepID=UPI0035AEB230